MYQVEKSIYTAATRATTMDRVAAITHNKTLYTANKIPPDRDKVMLAVTKLDRAREQSKWFEEFADITNGVPDVLPPLREINHRIPLITEDARYFYHLPKCAEALKPLLMAKIQRYLSANWWIQSTASQAAPMLCIPKKDNGLRTVVDCRKRNENTVKDVTPFPDQEQIRMDVARAPVRSKIDLSDAYEQIRIEPEDVPKTSFATVYGTMLSNVLQQGDCNGPATFQRLMTHVFRPYIGIFVHVYLDDIFIFSDSIEEHEEHLRIVFNTLRKHQLYLKASKCDLYSESMDCLGHLIDNRGLHADSDKMARIREWRPPRDYEDVQKILGLIQYLAHFMPDVSSFTGPLAAIVRNGHSFEWRPIHQRCLDSIKLLACKSPILQPIDPRRSDPIWLICDASKSGVGAVYGQGPTWKSCRPAGFMSKKFTDAQRSYRVFEQETLAILEALMRWEDKLLGRFINIVTDHESLQYLKSQPRLSLRQTRWMEYLSRFSYDIHYEKGEENIVADALSRYYAFDVEGEVHPFDDYVGVDVRLDREGEDLPFDRLAEYKNMRVGPGPGDVPKKPRGLVTRNELRAMKPVVTDDEDIEAVPAISALSPLNTKMSEDRTFLQSVRQGYASDTTFNKIMANPDHYAHFSVVDGLLFTKNPRGDSVLCIPRVVVGKRRLTERVIEQGHTLLGHLGSRKTDDYIRRWYWWPTLRRDIEKYCDSCGVCQTTKTGNQLPPGLLHSLQVPKRPWGSIAMDFVGPLPTSEGFDFLWVIICRLTSMLHLVPINTTTKASELAWIFVREIVRLHGLPDDILSDRDARFTSKFWKEVHRLLGNRLLMSTAFHPQTDGVTERANRSVIQVLRAIVKPDQSDWVSKLPLVEFALNSSVSKSTGFAPFELVQGTMPRMIQAIGPPRALPGVQQFAEKAVDNLIQAHDAIIDSRVHQTYHANKKRRHEDRHKGADKPLQKGELVYLSTENLSLPTKRARKLVPKYIGPYRIIDGDSSSSAYTLELPPDLKKRGIHPKFHVSRLRRHEPNDSILFPHRDTQVFYDMGTSDDQEWLVDSISAHGWNGKTLLFHVHWNLGDDSWEPVANVDELAALDEYLEALGTDDWRDLPRPPPAARRATRRR